MITKEQCRAARSLLGLKQSELAESCGISKTAITNFESGVFNPRTDTMSLIQEAFEKAGIEFIGDYGVQKRKHLFKVLSGENMLPDLWDDIFEMLKDEGGEVLISHLDERSVFQKYPEKLSAHLKRLKDHNITERLLVREDDTFFTQEPECYRWLPHDVFRAGMTFFVYGRRLALQFWDGSLILIIEYPEICAEERKRFEFLWENAKIPPYDTIVPQDSDATKL